MCHYTIGEAIYEDCVPNPSHVVRCVIFKRCPLHEDSNDVCSHPAVKKPEGVLEKHMKDGKCPICPKFSIVIRGRCVVVPDSPKSEDSFSPEKICL
ncbi:hypothetical protein M441DRAFT_309192 [Trichoderma asperellum CBS 433.97]|uniref:Uncharacterized protein n=1 Tax=Trichoderma asperellum (strain ATCC 204424 / CBS 433.97 / NBRC 101777) TaxID=1042311 RepID=A0A2T3ZK32_TRIA4|nr:hypothetical protein M441DRAFT_309192 [Trichoderma asperellum CBS 433.97]PTB45169.1 hypothetical protein M441DRAFT_309192 [Trichoderma asperellum CBS 433.97]